MTLSNGTKLSHYEITSQLGKGGMGEVYQAKDKKLGRDVAIKVLPPEFALDPDRIARFQREAKLLAFLNHPNIAAIHGLEEFEGVHFLVMELIEGQTLSDLLKRGPILAEEALKLALQIAEALEATHEKGVIHRDLKPANIKVTPEGKVKVLDFGLAKAFAGEQSDLNLSNSPTLSVAATQQGVILGTAAYMSPEQARGKPVDKRADIWAFGVVLFEMLTGKQIFTGDTVSDTLASVLGREPEWRSLPPNLHPRIRLLLERCLKKETTNRYRDIGDARVDIQEVLADPSNILAQPVLSEESRTKFQTMIPWLAATLVFGAVIAGYSVWSLRAPGPLKPIYFEHNLNEDRRFISSYKILAVSHDGNQFVYTTNKGLYLKSVNEPDAKLISSGSDYELCPFFSPDGKYVGYLSGVDGQLKRISTNGGAAEKICEIEGVMEASWSEDNTIIFYKSGTGIMKVSADGGTPETLIAMENEAYHPRILPDGKSVLYTGVTDEGLCVFVQTPESDKPKKLFKGENAYYFPTGHLAYAFGKNIWVVQFDKERLDRIGDPIKMIEGVWKWAGGPHFAVSDSGTLAYIPEPPTSECILVWVDREGNEDELSAPPGAYEFPRIALQGDKIAVSISSGGLWDISIWDIVRGVFNKLTNDGANLVPFWDPNGKKIYYSSIRSGIMDIHSMEVDGSGEDTLILHKPNTSLFVTSMLGDGTIICLYGAGTGSSDIGTLSPGDKTELTPLLNKKYMERSGKISPDDHWLAYESNEEGQSEVYVCSYPDVKYQKIKISVSGGHDPLWSPNGREVFYRSKHAVMAVSIETVPKLIAQKPVELFKDRYALLGDIETWDINPKDGRFLMVKDYSGNSGKERATLPRINIILNWFEEVKRKASMQ